MPIVALVMRTNDARIRSKRGDQLEECRSVGGVRASDLAMVPTYEVRVLTGKHKDKRAWVIAPWLARRELLPKKKRRAPVNDVPRRPPS